MSRTMLLATGGLLAVTAVAVAQAHIPTRYSGSFPSDGLRTAITGTFTGKSLTLNFTRVVRGRPLRRTFTGRCRNASPTQTSCSGRVRGSGNDEINASAVVTVTWSGGRPTAVALSK